MADKELGIVVRAKGTSAASQQIKGVESSFSNLTSRAGVFATKLRTNVGGALTHFRGRLNEAAKGIAAFAGVGGLLGIGGAIGTSVHKIEDFAVALQQVQVLTGETAKDSGTLILLFEKFGIGADQAGRLAGFAEKTLGKLNQTAAKTGKSMASAALKALELRKAEIQLHGGSVKAINLLIKEQKARDQIAAMQGGAATKLQALDKQYGLRLVDTKGKVVAFSEELRQLAGFYDTNASASTKAYVASQLLGKQYATMAPILAEGSKGLREAADAADSLGLGSADTVKQINDFRSGMRNLGEQTNLLQMSIGIALLPTLNKLATSAAAFISSHRADISRLFSDAAAAATQAAGVIAGLVGTISSFWNAIPEPFRNLLIGGIAADRTIKFIFGFSPIHAIASGIEGAVSHGIGSALGNSLAGSLLGGVQKVFVVNMGAGGLGGGLPAAAGAAEGGTGGLASFLAGGLLPMTIAAITPLALVALTDAIIGGADKIAANDLAGRGATAAARGLDPTKIALPGDIPRAGISAALTNEAAATRDGFARVSAQTALVAAGVHNLAGPTSQKTRDAIRKTEEAVKAANAKAAMQRAAAQTALVNAGVHNLAGTVRSGNAAMIAAQNATTAAVLGLRALRLVIGGAALAGAAAGAYSSNTTTSGYPHPVNDTGGAGK